METTKERLIKVMDALGVKQYELVTTCDGITKNMLQNLWNSKTDTVTTNILVPFCKRYTEVNCNWLLRGEGSMFLNTKCPDGSPNSKASEMELMIDRMSRDGRSRDAAYDIVIGMIDVIGKTYEFYKDK